MTDMTDRLALILGVESHQDPSLSTAPHADADATRFAEALDHLGFSTTLLVGPQATRTAIQSRLRKLAKTPAELLIVFCAARGFAINGAAYLACQDTLADDLEETGLALRELLADALSASAQRRAIFLDLRGTGWLVEPIERLFSEHPATVGLLASSNGEDSHVSGALKAGIWAHHLTELFRGKLPPALEGERFLTAQTLQTHLETEIPRTLRSTFREAPRQTPRIFGASERFVLADLQGIVSVEQPTADPRLQPLRRGSLRSESTSKVKSLSGYRKFHRLPDRVNASSRKFVADLAADDIKQDVDEIYAAVREAMGYKRRDVEGSADRGSGFVRTPDFEYSIGIDLVEDDPTTVIWRREVGGIQNPQVVLGKEFQRVFGRTFDTLVFEFARPFDLETWVDRVEDNLPDGVKLRTASDCSSCDVQVRGKACLIRLFRDRVEIQNQKSPGSEGLVEGFLHFQDIFSERKDVQALPLLN